ncbi:MAG: polyhydroxyalkanoic acid system family protein [Anaeromyxobacteraceae bacterium]
MHSIKKTYPGKSAHAIYEKVDAEMGRIAEKYSLDYESDEAKRTGKVSKMGATGTYACHDGHVEVHLKFPMLMPGSMRQKVQEDIDKKLTGLFG